MCVALVGMNHLNVVIGAYNKSCNNSSSGKLGLAARHACSCAGRDDNRPALGATGKDASRA